MISPTQLITRSLGIPHEGTKKASSEGRCVMCGGVYEVGDLVEPFSPKDSFTEYSDLQNPSGTHICGACKATWRKEFMQNYTKSVVCEGGLYPFFSNDAVAYWVLNPPPPPYLMFISTQQLGHIVWKVPVNMSRDLMLVRYNDKVLKIRRDHLLECVSAVRLLSDLLLKEVKPGRGQVAAALSDVGGQGAKALAAAINSGADDTVKRSVTVGGKQHDLGGISSTRTIAAVSNGSNSEDAPPVPQVAVK